MDALLGIAHQLGLTGEAAVPLLLILILGWAFYRLVSSDENPVRLWHFFATKTASGEDWGDVNSLGLVGGVIACLFAVLWIVYKSNDINPFVLMICLIYLGGVKVAANWMRSLADRKFAPPTPTPPAPEPKSIEHEVTKIDKTTTTSEAPKPV